MKIVLISNCSFNLAQGSGYATSQYYFYGLDKKGVQIQAYEPKDFESFKFLRPYANSYRQALGMLLLTIRKWLFTDKDIFVFYGAESFAAIWFLTKVVRTKSLVVHHSNGIENHSIDVLTREFGFATIDNKPPKWYQLDRYRLFLSSFKNCDLLITNGLFDKDYAVSKNILPANRVVSIDLGIEDDFLNLGYIAPKEKIITYCGTWIARKGIDIIQNDLPLFLKAFPEYQLHIIGCGEFFNKNEVFEKSLQNQILVFPFVKDKAKLKTLYLKSSIVLFPSYYDSFGLVLAEAMACSCAPVCNATGFAYGLNHLKDSFQLPQNRKGELFIALTELVKNEPLRQIIAKGAYNRVQSLRWNDQVDNLYSILQKGIKDKSSNK